MSEAVVSPTIVILPGATWKAELVAEFIRLGMPEDRAPISAGRVLSRICRHAGYLRAFVYDEADAVDVTQVGGAQHRSETAP